jgi:hypothetical protein
MPRAYGGVRYVSRGLPALAAPDSTGRRRAGEVKLPCGWGFTRLTFARVGNHKIVTLAFAWGLYAVLLVALGVVLLRDRQGGRGR